MKKEYYRLTTTFLGADGASAKYYSTAEAAKKALAKLNNGEVDKVEITAPYLNTDGFFEGCSFAHIVYGDFADSTETEIR